MTTQLFQVTTGIVKPCLNCNERLSSVTETTTVNFIWGAIPSFKRVRDKFFSHFSCLRLEYCGCGNIASTWWRVCVERFEVKIRFCGGCSVSRAHKTSLRPMLFCVCVLPSSLLTLTVVIISTTAQII